MRERVPFINRMSLRNKLAISFILIFLPLLLLSSLSISLYSNEIENKLLNSAIGNNEQIIYNLDNSLKMLIKLSEYPLYDDKLIEILKTDYDNLPNPKLARSNDFEKARVLLNNNIVFYSDLIDSVWLYGLKQYDLRGRALVETMQSNYSLTSEKWLEKVESMDGGAAILGIHPDRQKLPGNNFVISVARVIKDKSSRQGIGIIIINVDINKLERLWMDRGPTQNTRFYLVDENNRVIYSKNRQEIYQSFDSILHEDIAQNPSLKGRVTLDGEKYQLISIRSDISDWKVVSLIPTKELFAYNMQMSRLTLFIGGIVIVLTIGAIYLITTSVAKPIYALSQSMKKIGEGDFDVTIGRYYGEMGIIGNAISLMQTRIKNLIQKIYIEEDEKRKAEMHALQAQINPHFLYNTMSAIKWMANIQGATSIEKALNSLAFLMAYTSKWNNDLVSIADEMVFIENYISILDIRYYNKFKVNYRIDEEAYKYKTLKFMLQPMIENAVFHGFEGLQRMGELDIIIKKEEDEILFSVADNGQGFETERMKTILEEDIQKTRRQRFNSIGLSNVHKRIKLHFGEQYGLTIQSRLNEGTTVLVRIPAILDRGEEQREDHDH